MAQQISLFQWIVRFILKCAVIGLVGLVGIVVGVGTTLGLDFLLRISGEITQKFVVYGLVFSILGFACLFPIELWKRRGTHRQNE